MGGMDLSEILIVFTIVFWIVFALYVICDMTEVFSKKRILPIWNKIRKPRKKKYMHNKKMRSKKSKKKCTYKEMTKLFYLFNMFTEDLKRLDKLLKELDNIKSEKR